MNRKQFIERYMAYVPLAEYLSEKPRREGLLSLEDDIGNIDDDFLKEGLRLVIDGTDASVIDEILTNRIAHEKDKYMRIFRNIQKRTLLGVQAGCNTRVILLVLNSLAGTLPEEEAKINDLLLASFAQDGKMRN